jgi:2-dehydropantoate 2-reductase
MRVTVLGVGAVGGWLAAGLARAGAEVRLFARGTTLAALQADGLVFAEDDRIETFRLPAGNDPAAFAGADILLMGMKGHDVPAARETIAALAGERTVIVPALNGIPWWFTDGLAGPAGGATLESVDPGGALAAAFPARRVIGCVAHVGTKLEAPGRVRLMKADRLLLGDPSGHAGDRPATLAALFQAGGVPARVVPDIRTEVWSKLWGNMSMNPLSALCRAGLTDMIDDPGTHGMMVMLMQEMAAIGDRIGLPLTEDIPARIAVARRLGAFRTSMLQDLEAGRRLELGPIIGGLVELAERLGVEVPVTRGVHGLTRLLAENLSLR